MSVCCLVTKSLTRSQRWTLNWLPYTTLYKGLVYPSRLLTSTLLIIVTDPSQIVCLCMRIGLNKRSQQACCGGPWSPLMPTWPPRSMQQSQVPKLMPSTICTILLCQGMNPRFWNRFTHLVNKCTGRHLTDLRNIPGQLTASLLECMYARQNLILERGVRFEDAESWLSNYLLASMLSSTLESMHLQNQ